MKLRRQRIKHIILFGILLFYTPILHGCLPLVFAAAAGSGYLMGDEDAKREVGIWMADLSQKARSIKIQTEDAAKELIHYKEGSGLVMEFNSFSVSPATVKRGELITVDMEYVIVGAAGGGVKIQERSDLWFGGEKIVVLGSKKVKRENGTWKNTIIFEVPSSAQIGKHKINQTLSTNQSKLMSSGYFIVST